MPLTRRLLLSRAAAFPFLSVLASRVAAQPGAPAWTPDKVIRLISPSPPGGGTDATARLVAQKLTENAKWQVIVDNKPGAGNNIGLDIGAKSAPDGWGSLGFRAVRSGLALG